MNRSRPMVIGAAVIVVLLAVSFGVGRLTRTSRAEAQAAAASARQKAFTAAERRSYASARAVAYRRGVHAGRRAGRRVGTKQGYEAGLVHETLARTSCRVGFVLSSTGVCVAAAAPPRTTTTTPATTAPARTTPATTTPTTPTTALTRR